MSALPGRVGVVVLVAAATGAIPWIETSLAAAPTRDAAALLAAVPLTLVLSGVWVTRRQLRPASATQQERLRRWVLLGVVLVAGPALGALVAAYRSGVIVLPGPLPVAETLTFALLEELVFRGLPLVVLLRFWRGPRVPGMVAVMLLSAVVFTAAHGASTVATAVDRAWFAVLASAVVYLTGRLAAAVVLHTSSNLYWYAVQGLPARSGVLVAVDVLATAGLALLLVRGATALPVGLPDPVREAAVLTR